LLLLQLQQQQPWMFLEVSAPQQHFPAMLAAAGAAAATMAVPRCCQSCSMVRPLLWLL
jgi:hypothetical protein